MRTNRRKVTGALAGVTAIMMLAGCGGEPEAQQAGATKPPVPAGSTMAKLQEKGRIVVGTKTDVPLFGETNPTTGKPEGFDVSIANALAERLFGSSGRVEFVEAPTPTRESLIMQNKVDMVVATYTINDARKEKVSFAGPYYNVRNSMLVKIDDKEFGEEFAGFEALSGHSVCASQGSPSYVGIGKTAPGAKLTGFDQEGKCVSAVQQGRAQGFVSDDAILVSFLAAYPNTFKLVRNSKAGDEPYGIGVTKGDAAFCNWINDQLKDMFSSGKWQQTFDETVGKVGATSKPPTPDQLTNCQ